MAPSPAAAGRTGGNNNDAAGLADPLLPGGGAAAAAKDKYWVPADEEEEEICRGEVGGRPPAPLLYRTFKVSGVLLHPYRLLTLVRLIAVVLFLRWRMKHRDSDAMWLWWISVAGDFWFGVTWLLNQASKLNPVKRVPDLSLLRQRFDDGLPTAGNGGGCGSSLLPGIDVFINTVDPVDEPMLYTMNSVLSILATDYPADRHVTYLSDDGASLVHYEGLIETARFAVLWVPFCRKHRIEPRAPESYFAAKAAPYAGPAPPEEFVGDRRFVRREYEEFKARLDALFTVIPQRSEARDGNTNSKDTKATLMTDGTQWPGTWTEPAQNHKKGQHAGIVKIMAAPASSSFNLRSILEKEKLNGTNFMDWYHNLRIVLRQERKEFVLEEPFSEDLPNTATAAQRRENEKRQNDYLDVSCLMLATMSPDLQRQYETLDAHSIITGLRSMFENQARAERFNTSKSLFACRLAEGNPVSPHVIKMIGYIESLEKLGFPLSQELATDLILQSLPPSFEPFILNYNMNNMVRTLAELHGMLKGAEESIKKNSNHVMVMHKRKPNNKKVGQKRKLNSDEIASTSNSKTKAQKTGPAKDAECFFCKETGHWKRNCKKYLEHLKQKQQDGKSSTSGAENK